MEDPLIGRVLLHRYRITHELGRGGMSTVYRGEQQMGGVTRPVAIKVLDRRATNDPYLAERFRREAGTVVRLRHPNTVEIYDVGELADGLMFFVMEFIEGESLSAVIKRGPMAVDRVDRILLQVCGSVHDAHEMGVVHRDLKPANVLITRRGTQEDFVKVLDFGVAKTDWDAEQLTGDDSLIGTPAYMSPEQFMNASVDARADIYAMGLLAYQMVTGRLPFSAKTLWDWASKHVTEVPPPIGALPNGQKLHPRKEQAIMRALAKDPKARQATALEFLREFTGFKDVGAAWAQATSGSGAEPASSLMPPPGPGGGAADVADLAIDLGTFDTAGKHRAMGAARHGLPGVYEPNPAAGTPPRPAPPAPKPPSVRPPPAPPGATLQGGFMKAAPKPQGPAPRVAPPAPPGPPKGIMSSPTVAQPRPQQPPPQPAQPAAQPPRAPAQVPSMDMRPDSLQLDLDAPNLGLQGGLAPRLEPRAGTPISLAPVKRRGGHEDMDWGGGGHQADVSIGLATDGAPPVRPPVEAAEPEGLSERTLRFIQIGVAIAIVVAVVVVGIRISQQWSSARGTVQGGQDAGPMGGLEPDGVRILAEARNFLHDGDVEAAVGSMEEAQRLGKYEQPMFDAVRAELSAVAGEHISQMIRRGRCEDAQKLYVRLGGLEAHMSAKQRFTTRCPRP